MSPAGIAFTVDPAFFDVGLAELAAKVKLAASEATKTAADLLITEVRNNITGPPRWVNHKNVNPREGGPGIETGYLRNESLRKEVTSNLVENEVMVTSDAPYANALEYGHPRWHRAGGYPYFRPAEDSVQAKVYAIYTTEIAAALEI